jgi:hypothetical protein
LKINFTKKQFGVLLEILHLGEWTANSSKTHDERNADYDSLFQYVCSFAKDFGHGHVIEYDKRLEGYFPTKEFEEKLHPLIEHNDNEVFWSKLTLGLAKRDLAENGETFSSHEDYMRKIFELEEKYEIEFEKNGIKNLIISHNL